MFTSWYEAHGGPLSRLPSPAVAALLAAALVAVAAVTSLFGPDQAQRVAGSAWFLAGTGLVALFSLLAILAAPRRRARPAAVQHLGLVIALLGIAVNQKACRSGYLFLEQAANGRNYCLSHNLRRLVGLPGTFALDSIGSFAVRGFRPAPVAWVSSSDGRLSRAVTYNRPLHAAGWQLLLSQLVGPGFLEEYAVVANNETHRLMHNQVLEPTRGLRIWSTAFDPAKDKVGLMVGDEQRWLGVGDTLTAPGLGLKLTRVTFAANPGAIFVVNDTRYRFIIFAGFGLILLGLVPSFIRGRSP